MNIVFMGTAELACPILGALHAKREWTIKGVVTQPDRPRGRNLKLEPGPVKTTAMELNLPVLQPEKARHPDFIAQLRELAPDLSVVAAYGQILPQAILDIPRFGCLNVHTSLLPKYRGAAPIQWAILEDQPMTGITIMKMDPGLDTGDILTQKETPINEEDNGQTLHDRLASIGAQLLVETIPPYFSGAIKPRPQPAEGASYARKITKEDGLLNWSMPARELWNRVRAFNPWPGAYTYFGVDRKLLKVWQARPEGSSAEKPGMILQADKSGIVVACSAGALRILNLQREGGRRLLAHEFLAGQALKVGDQVG